MAAAAVGAGAGAGAGAWPHKRIAFATADATTLRPVVEAKTTREITDAVDAARVELAALSDDTQLKRVLRMVAADAEVLSGQRMFNDGVHQTVDPLEILRWHVLTASVTQFESDCVLMLNLLRAFGVLDAVMRDADAAGSVAFSLTAHGTPQLVHAVLDMADEAGAPAYTVSFATVLRAMSVNHHVLDVKRNVAHRLIPRLSEEDWAAAPGRECALLSITHDHPMWTVLFLNHCAFDGTRFPLSHTPGTADLIPTIRLRNAQSRSATWNAGFDDWARGFARNMVLDKDAEILRWRAAMGVAIHGALDLPFRGGEFMGLYALVVAYMFPQSVLVTVLPPRPPTAPIAAAAAAAASAPVASVVVSG